jgi:hypothetical protein
MVGNSGILLCAGSILPPFIRSTPTVNSIQLNIYLAQSTNAPGKWLIAHILPLHGPTSKPLRLLKRYSLLTLAFFISGLIHAAGSYLVTRDLPLPTSSGGAFAYFLLQPAMITLEDLVSHVLGIIDDGKPSRWRRIIGYVYVGVFWCWCFPVFKVLPLARAHGLGGDEVYLGGVIACRELAEALPFNPVKTMIEGLFAI